MPFIVFLCAALILVLLVCFICARMVFYVHSTGKDETTFPKGKQYAARKDQILSLIAQASALPYEDVYITNAEGLRLHGKFYFSGTDVPTHILFHGYRSSALLDFSGGLCDTVNRGHNALLVDQRAHAASEGKYLSFGINESRDCLEWIDYVKRRMGAEKPIIIEGVSMGGATVLMAAGLELPENVIGILADSAYSSPERIIRHVMRKQHYPQLLFPFIRLGGRIFCGFDICENEPVRAIKNCKVPVFFIHGNDDRFVPYEMGRENYDACPTKKYFFTGEGAGHAISYLVDLEGYRKAHEEFLNEIL